MQHVIANSDGEDIIASVLQTARYEQVATTPQSHCILSMCRSVYSHGNISATVYSKRAPDARSLRDARSRPQTYLSNLLCWVRRRG
jgi:hypothetical protein